MNTEQELSGELTEMMESFGLGNVSKIDDDGKRVTLTGTLITYINKHYVRKEGIDELLEKVLELFVQEPSQKNAVFVSPEQQLRHQADLIEAKDKVAERFRQLVDSLIKDKEGE